MKSLLSLSIAILSFLTHSHLQGQQAIGHTTLTYTNQNGTYTDTVYYPATSSGLNAPLADGEFPLIVFGNGFQFPISNYPYLIDSLVPCGYLLVYHDNRFTLFGGTSSLEFAENLSFLVDTFLSMDNNPISFFHNALNGNSATVGHGLGGNAGLIASTLNDQISTVVMLGPTADCPNCSPNSNPNMVVIAGEVNKPTLTFGSTNGMIICPMAPVASENPLPIYNAIDSSFKSFIEILEGTYCGYLSSTALPCFATCTSGSEITPQAQQAIIIDYIKKWFDIYLYQDCCAYSDFHDCLNTDTDIVSMSEGDGGCPDQLSLMGIIPTDIYQADISISASGVIEMNSTVLFKARMETSLLPVFEVALGAELLVQGLGCN